MKRPTIAERIAAGARRFAVIDADGLLRHKWLTDETEARRYHAKFHPTLTLVGPRGETLARPTFGGWA